MYEVNFLGHVISRGGVVVDPSKVEVMVIWEQPKNASKVRISWVCRLLSQVHYGIFRFGITVNKTYKEGSFLRLDSKC